MRDFAFLLCTLLLGQVAPVVYLWCTRGRTRGEPMVYLWHTRGVCYSMLVMANIVHDSIPPSAAATADIAPFTSIFSVMMVCQTHP